MRHHYSFLGRKLNRKIRERTKELDSQNAHVIAGVRNIIDRSIILSFP